MLGRALPEHLPATRAQFPAASQPHCTLVHTSWRWAGRGVCVWGGGGTGEGEAHRDATLLVNILLCPTPVLLQHQRALGSASILT